MSLDLGPYLNAIEGELRDIVSCPEGSVARLYGMMQYHMGWVDRDLQPAKAATGKRLRPLLCLLACQAVGGQWRDALPAAAAIELTHSFSLVHDDIEDKSHLRRHRPTVWSVWGLAQGVNTGDALWTLARLSLYRLLEGGHDQATVLAVSLRMEETCLKLCTGQYLDLAFEDAESITVGQYRQMIAGKTAALIEASTTIGALLGGAEPKVVEAYGQFGHELGMGFQVVDDILGIWGEPSVTGKSVASDILERKKTLPILYALEWEAENSLDELSRLFAQDQLTPADVAAVLGALDRAQARTYGQCAAQEHHRRALESLATAGGQGPAYTALCSLAETLVDRAY